MKRTPLARTTRLAPGSKPLARTGGPERKTRLAKVGARGTRERRAVDQFRRAVLERANGNCERCGRRRPLHAHHMRARAQGGAHSLTNGAALCVGEYGCHARVHRYEVEDWPRWIRQRKAARA